MYKALSLSLLLLAGCSTTVLDKIDQTTSTCDIESLKQQNTAESLNNLGEIYHFNKCGYALAKEYYLKAVNLGSAEAANHLGRLYTNGEGVEKSDVEAQKWYDQSVKLDPSNKTCDIEHLKQQNSAESLNTLGENYHFSQCGIKQDYALAKEYYLKAINLGSARAANHLGRLYSMGEGVEKSPVEAQKWYDQSVKLDPSDFNKCVNGKIKDFSFCQLLRIADVGNKSALQAVGEVYATGLYHGKKCLIPKNPALAKEYNEKSKN
jgi:tetratricopeptide (TPR) repeat protein